MAIDVLLVREGSKLAAADPLSAESIAGLKHGETLTATIRRQRNPAHHRKWWALVGVVFEHQTLYATQQDLNNAIKIACGYFESGKTIEGMPWTQPKSISYAAMDQTSFEQFYNRAVDVILTRILPNVQRADLEARVHEILDGNSNYRSQS